MGKSLITLKKCHNYLLSFGLLLIFNSCYSNVQREIPFHHIIIDDCAIGHRAVGDIDGNSSNDIVALNKEQLSDKLVWYEYPNWKKHAICDLQQFCDYQRYRACDLKLADLDGDGDLDLIGRIGSMDDQAGINCWFENPLPHRDPAKDFWQRHDLGTCEYAKNIEVVDLNKDGKPDIIYRTVNARLIIYLQKSPSSWDKVLIQATKGDGLATGDLDQDGDPDLVLNGYWLETPAVPLRDNWVRHEIDSKWYNQKTAGKNNWYDNNSKIVVADINHAGRLDVVISQSENKGFPVCWYEANDSKGATWKEHYIGQIDYCHSLQVTDFNNDGHLDVLAAEMPRYDAPYPVVLFINRGDSLNWSEQIISLLGTYNAIIGDLGNDGDIDIIGVRNYNKPPIEIWENKINY